MDRGDASQQGGAQAGWSFHAEQTPQKGVDKQQTASVGPGVEWTASEYIAHDKNAGWYVLVFAAAAVLAAAVYVISRDVVSFVVIILVAVIFVLSAGRKPRVLAYRLDEAGLTIGQKFYPYESFKSFSVEDKGAYGSVDFLPLKRFMPDISVYFAAEDSKKVMEALSRHLPFERRRPNMLDALVSRLRF